MTDKQDKPIDDPFDFRDEIMDIDDAVSSVDPQSESAVEQQDHSEGANWQSSLVNAAKNANLPSDIIDRLQGPDAVNDLMSIIASSLQKEQNADPEVAYKPRRSTEGEFQLDIDESTAFDPDAARALKSMNEFYSAKFRDLEEKYAGRTGNDGGVSSFVSELGSDWQSVFGTNGKPMKANVKKLEESVATIRAGYLARHKRVPSDGEVLKMALSASFGDRQTEIARNQFTNKVSNRESQIVSRPGTRTAPSSNPRIRAAQGVADWFKSKGIDPYSNSNDTFQ